MSQKRKPVALIDLDGTLADFDGAMARDLKAICGPNEPQFLGPEHEDIHPHVKARRDLIKRQPDWWYRLEVLPRGFEILAMLRQVGYKLHILTRASKHIPSSWEQKVRWARKYIPDAGITITLDKSLMDGQILVDDWPSYIEAWLKYRPNGLVIMPDQPWNRGFSHMQTMRYTGTSMLDELRHTVIAKYAKYQTSED